MNRNGTVYFTSESVTEGHPDKVADQISDAILDAIMEQDPQGRVAAETLVTTGLVLVAGEITTRCYVDIPQIARQTVKEIGYTRAKYGFDGDTCSVLTSIDEQSSDIALGVDESWEIKSGEDRDDAYNRFGAGDQGIIFGFACNETPELMPMPIFLAHKLTRRLAAVRKERILPYLRPDGKSQVTVEYRDGRPYRIAAVVLAAQHRDDIPLPRLREDLVEVVVREVIPPELLDKQTRYLINATGRFVIGGPLGDTGLTGRKIIVDTYGGYSRHGGGCFSGKDPTKVDRSASYTARYVAKNVVAAGLADKCELELAYAIGVARPVSVYVETFNTEKVPVELIEKLISKHFDLRPAAMIDKLNMRRPIYKQIAAYGHYGRDDLDLPWERTDLAATLKQEAGITGVTGS
ncbi:MAG: methionine adenosyltransferase [Dethiobacter sp.]|jgi:S-adenosylmethionine synthetase|nr:MAG: methionine adenosyltransferase [Dethiobacter sp.]